jgi:hypothetical protein
MGKGDLKDLVVDGRTVKWSQCVVNNKARGCRAYRKRWRYSSTRSWPWRSGETKLFASRSGRFIHRQRASVALRIVALVSLRRCEDILNNIKVDLTACIRIQCRLVAGSWGQMMMLATTSLSWRAALHAVGRGTSPLL